MMEIMGREFERSCNAMPEEAPTHDKIEDIREQYRKSKQLAKEIIGSYSVHCNQNLFLMQLNRNNEFKWNFTIKSNKNTPIKIRRLFLLQSHMPEFCVDAVKIDFNFHKLKENCQFWECSNNGLKVISMQASVSFVSACYGHFEQQVIFEFQNGEKIVRNVGVEVLPEAKLMETLQFKPVKLVESEMSWIEKYTIAQFDGEPEISFDTLRYPLSPYLEDLVFHGAFDNFQKKITEENYRDRLHLLLHIEENERRKKLQQLSFGVEDIHDFINSPIPGLHRNRILRIPSENTQQAYQLIGKSGKALVKICSPFDSMPCVYEVLLEQILCSEFVFELSSELDSYLQLSQCPLRAIFCFRFVDVFKFMHNAIDQINIRDVFPINHQQGKETWNFDKYEDLSREQSIALHKMIESADGPPVLLLGPFGSGKTRTMAHAVLELYRRMKRKNSFDSRILICTHSNSAADHYIESFIDPFLVHENPSHPVLIRVNWELRYTASVSKTVLKYCEVSHGKFIQPKKSDIEKHIIVVSTLVTANILHDIGIGKDFFTHIFIDEAAQAMEVEAIIPLMLKGERTKVILAGDHFQLGFPLVSSTAKELGLGISLLERLFLEYPSDSQFKLKLLENHRSLEEIVDISSSLFYEGALVSNKPRPPNTRYPVQFFGIHGKEEISLHHPSVFNVTESHEVLRRIQDLIEVWPNCFGSLSKSKICVLSYYSAQIQEIRLLLRRNSLGEVRVENVNNVQGLEFDVVIISTVRCYNELFHQRTQYEELGFLGNPKLLNTAVTRAKYLCIVVGEPVALCSFGACKGLWKTILAMSHLKGEFHYRLAYKEIMEISEKLCEMLCDTHTVEQSLESVITREQDLSVKNDNSSFCYGNKTSRERPNESSAVSANDRNDSSLNYGNEDLQLEISIPQRFDFAMENSLPVSPAPSEMSCMSDMPNSNTQAAEFSSSAELLVANGGKESTHHDSIKMQESRDTGINLNNNGNSGQFFPFTHKQPSKPTTYSPFAIISKVRSPDDIMKLAIELDLINLFVSDFLVYSGNEFQQIQDLARPLISTKDTIMAELLHLRSNFVAFSADHIFQKFRNAHCYFITSLHSMETALLSILPVVSNDVFQLRQGKLRSLKDSFIHFGKFLENLLESLKLLVSVHGQMSGFYFEANKLLDFVFFILREVDTWTVRHVTEEPRVKYSFLFEFKLNFLVVLFNALQKEAHRIKGGTMHFELYRTMAFPTHSQSSGVNREEKQWVPTEREKRPAHFDDNVYSSRKRTDIPLCGHNLNKHSLPENCNDAKTSNAERGNDIVEELSRLTMENVFEDVDVVDGLCSLIERLRHYDEDVNEWFVNRETDTFVIEYIKDFERYRASARTSNTLNCLAPSSKDGDPSELLNQPTRKSEYFDRFTRFKKEVPYPQYCKIASGMSKGVMSYEKSSSCEKPKGIVLFGHRRIVFPGLESLNRSLDGDEVLFKVVGRHGEHERGRVERVVKRGVKSLLCKISLNDSSLLLPIDERGPPIIAFNASEPFSSNNRQVGGDVRKCLVQIIGWPVELKFPVGVIQREAQEHVEE